MNEFERQEGKKEKKKIQRNFFFINPDKPVHHSMMGTSVILATSVISHLLTMRYTCKAAGNDR